MKKFFPVLLPWPCRNLQKASSVSPFKDKKPDMIYILTTVTILNSGSPAGRYFFLRYEKKATFMTKNIPIKLS